jgi:hypothetical protein
VRAKEEKRRKSSCVKWATFSIVVTSYERNAVKAREFKRIKRRASEPPQLFDRIRQTMCKKKQ